ncbi:MAG: Zn-dependent protease [Candidatus Peregrinibacteria bacterium Greene0416_62]|nr:MAG: Zn-dependent protease [Candidatus Peregrinibacteria bacterium Greene0416_62]TSC99107.1 MAG: Zn-dependent protease [Candidatus Peregrinibacteria bacterium Greene1014_49]
MSALRPSFIIALLIALSVHEWAHAMIANRLGDPTAKEQGRLTLNPIAHLDLMGTILFFLVGFGWGKPVPIDPRYFKHWKRDTALVSIAGPVSNLIVAFLAFGGLLLLAPGALAADPWELLMGGTGGTFVAVFTDIFRISIALNLGLMAFNLLPIAPLDGSKILQVFVPYQYDAQYHLWMQRGPWILLGLLIAEDVLHIPLLMGWIDLVLHPILVVMSWIAGAF